MGGRGGSSGLAPNKKQKEMTLSERIAQAKKEAQAYKQSRQNEEKETRTAYKDTKQQSQITDYISKQIGIDLNKYRDSTSRSFEPKDAVNVDWKRMPREVKDRIRNLSNQYKGTVEITLEDVGAWMKQIKIRRKRR